ncbi:MAG TPA: ribosome biogenesis GTP-binding protein YihA/YsxC [Casimicrobiaceae bacterium]|nr:ribosome biogenesis GTP-binding protein YihA/YsxC [Casimicrobiaceae bacterium]
MWRQPDKQHIVPKQPSETERLSLASGSLLHHAEFLTTAAEWRQLPSGGAPEVAFAGRSNAGKSSAINALTQRTQLAFASKTPGRTRHINFFRLRSGALLADLPGYGYAQVPAGVRRHWQQFLARYLAERTPLVGLVLIVDARHPLTPLDRQTLDWFLPAGLPVHVLLAKSDKLSRSVGKRALEEFRRMLDKDHPRARVSAQLFSATNRNGVAEAQAVISSWLEGKPGEPHKKKGPGVKGSDRGPKNALRPVL